jgi:hypothetical protein
MNLKNYLLSVFVSEVEVEFRVRDLQKKQKKKLTFIIEFCA